ncbi:MAG: putative O-glycosylation ligase, exosortase A system-associated [Rhodocyclaceae bacterium]
MRDLAMAIAMLGFVYLAFSSNLVAYLLWGWTAFVAINFYLYGFLASFQFNMLFAVVSVAMFALAKDPEKLPFLPNRVSILFLLFAVQLTLTFVFALDGSIQSYFFWTLILKVLLFGILMPMVITTRVRIYAMAVTLTLGLAMHGVVEGGKFINSGGGHHVVGLPKFGDNNHFALLVVMGMPLLIYMFQHSVSKLVKLSTVFGLIFSVAAVVGTHSRGGLLSMMLAGGWLVWSGRRKGVGIAALIAGAVIIVATAPESWSERMNTIKTAEEDSSFMGRVEAWKVSSAIALARPLTGGGIPWRRTSISLGGISR